MNSASGASDDPLLLDRQVCFPLYAATNLLTRLYRPVLAPLGLTYSQYLVMLALWEQAPLSVGDLGTRLHLDGGTLTPMLKRMEQNGLVNRRRDTEDERRVLIGLTAAGRALRRKARVVPLTLRQQVGLDAATAEQLRGSINHLVQVLMRASAA